MRNALQLAFVLTLVLVPLTAHSNAESPELAGRSLEAFSAQPKTTIEHELQWKSAHEPEKRSSYLKGPGLFATSESRDESGLLPIIFSGYSIPAQRWFELPAVLEQDKRRVHCRDAGGRKLEFQLKQAEWFLSPTQVLREGPPADVPEGLGHFVMYSVAESSVEEPPSARPEAPASRRLENIVFVCMPAEEWHHDDYFPAGNKAAGWIVYKTDEPAPEGKPLSTLDQFGLNSLTLAVPKWTFVPVYDLKVVGQ